MDNWPGWLQTALAVVSAIIAAIFGTVTATLRFSARLERQDRRHGELREDLHKLLSAVELRSQQQIGDMELRIERQITESRHQVMQTLQGVVIAPLEKLEQRVGTTEQDIAVLKDRAKMER